MEAHASATILDYATPNSRLNLKRYLKPLLICFAIITLSTLIGMMVGRAFTRPSFRTEQVLYIEAPIGRGSVGRENFLWTTIELVNSTSSQNGVLQELIGTGVISANDLKKYRIAATLDRKTNLIRIGVTGENSAVASSIAQAMQRAMGTSLFGRFPSENISIDTLESNTVRLSSWKRPSVVLGMMIGCIVGFVFILINKKRLASA